MSVKFTMSNPLHEANNRTLGMLTDDEKALRDFTRISEENNSTSQQVVEIKSLKEPIFYDSLNNHFNFLVFVQQLVIHLFLPFSGLLSPNFTIQGFGTEKYALMFFHYFIPSLVIIYLVSYFVEVEKYDEDSYPLQLCWVFPSMVYVLHRVLIALKYATMSKTEYMRYFSASSETVPHYVKQTQLLSAWQDLSQDHVNQVLNFEVVAGGLRCGKVVNDLYLYLENPAKNSEIKSHFLRWKTFLALAQDLAKNDNTYNPMQIMGDGSYRIPLICAIKSIILSVEKKNKNMKKNILSLSNVASIINIIIPIAEYIRSCAINKSFITGLSITFLVLSSVLNFVFYDILIKFTLTALIDTFRRRDFLLMSNELLRSSDMLVDEGVNASIGFSTKADPKESSLSDRRSMHDSKMLEEINVAKNDMAFLDELINCIIDQQKDVCGKISKDDVDDDVKSIINHHIYREGDVIDKLPIITMHDSRNVICWTHLQHIFINFGARYKSRLDLLVQIVLSYVGVLFAGAISFVYLNSRGQLAAFNSAFFRQAFVTMTFYLLFLVLLVSASANVTLSRSKSRLALIKHAMKCTEDIAHIKNKSIISESDRNEITRLEALYGTIIACDDSIGKSIEVSPYMTLSLPATPALLSSVISAVSSFYITIFSIYIKAATSQA